MFCAPKQIHIREFKPGSPHQKNYAASGTHIRGFTRRRGTALDDLCAKYSTLENLSVDTSALENSSSPTIHPYNLYRIDPDLCKIDSNLHKIDSQLAHGDVFLPLLVSTSSFKRTTLRYPLGRVQEPYGFSAIFFAFNIFSSSYYTFS